jgi:hypothetical protein
MRVLTIKVIVGASAALGIAAVLFIGHFGRAPSSNSAITAVAPEVIHTSDWYLAHRDVLAVDEKRCAGDAAGISHDACQNVSNAVSQINYNNVQNLLGQAVTSNK